MDLKNMTLNERINRAANPATSENNLQELARNHYRVRAAVAENPSTPIQVLRNLTKDEAWIVIRNVTENPSTPEGTLRNLATDKYGAVRCSVAENPTSSSKILGRILDFETSLKVPNNYVIKALYKNDKLPYIAKVIIETLFGDML